MAEDVTNRGHENYHHHRAHSRRQPGVHSRRGLDPAKVQECKPHRKNNFPAPVRDRRSKFMRLSRAPDHANQWIHNVIHHHAPTRHIPDRRVDLLRHIRERRPRARVRSRHPTIADGGKKHGHHGDQECGHHVAAAAIAQRAKGRHRRHRLQHDHSVENQIPKRKRPPQPRRGANHNACFAAHVLLIQSFQIAPILCEHRASSKRKVPSSICFITPCDTGPPPCFASPNSANSSPPPPKKMKKSAFWPATCAALPSRKPHSLHSICVVAFFLAVRNASSPSASRFSFALSLPSQKIVPRNSPRSFAVTATSARALRKSCATRP